MNAGGTELFDTPVLTDALKNAMTSDYDGLDDTKYNVKVHPAIDLTHDPELNVLNMDIFRARVAKIFDMTANALSKSYGPFGSSTIIADNHYAHVTKDGYSIMKNLSFSKQYTLVDEAIRKLIDGPCNRLNYAVGDGTTTVIIAVNSIYQEFHNYLENEFKRAGIPPREILAMYNKVRDKIIKELDNEIIPVDVNDHDAMVETMTKIAEISSNGDEELTGLIHDLYDELDYPLIEIKKAADGITKKTITKGYQYEAVLRSQIYVTNDNFTAEHENCDVLIFDHKINLENYNNIIKPLNENCRVVGRHLIVIAPTYDDIAMADIKNELLTEFRQTRSCNLILMTGKMVAGNKRELTEDLAMMLNTQIISMGLEKKIIDDVKKTGDILKVVNLDNRHIEGIKVRAFQEYDVEDETGETVEKLAKVLKTFKEEDFEENNIYGLTLVYNVDDTLLDVGFAGKVTLPMKGSALFDDLHYNQNTYELQLKTLEYSLAESKKKSEAISTYNFEAKHIEERLYRLHMKVGTIEVGGESGLSQELRKDVVDDVVKATASAYHNGVVKGCSVSTLKAINHIMTHMLCDSKKNADTLEYKILGAIFKGFRNVYRTLLESRYDDVKLPAGHNYFDLIGSVINWNVKYRFNSGVEIPASTLIDDIIDASLYMNEPYNLVSQDFDPNIINSAKTDKEILLASSDLISLLITGNQFVASDYTNYGEE